MRHERAMRRRLSTLLRSLSKKKTQKSKNTLLYKNARLTDQAANTGSRIDTGGSLLLESSHFFFLFFSSSFSVVTIITTLLRGS